MGCVIVIFFYDLGCSGDLKYVSTSRECVESCPCGTYQLLGSCETSKSITVIIIMSRADQECATYQSAHCHLITRNRSQTVATSFT